MHPSVRFSPQPWLKLGLALAMALTIGMSNASAQLDDPQVAIGPGTGTDPVALGQTSMVTITNQGSGSGFDLPSWYLILGVANTGSTIANTTTVQVTSVNASATTIGGSFVTTMKSGQNAYDQLNAAQPTIILPNYDKSESFTNWVNGTGGGPGELSLGINATSFSLFEFKINAPLSAGGTDTIGFNADLPLGAYVIAYGENGKHAFSTPFTTAGLETIAPPGSGGSPPPPAVPAPAGLVLVLSGCGAYGMFSLLRRRSVIAHAV